MLFCSVGFSQAQSSHYNQRNRVCQGLADRHAVESYATARHRALFGVVRPRRHDQGGRAHQARVGGEEIVGESIQVRLYDRDWLVRFARSGPFDGRWRGVGA